MPFFGGKSFVPISIAASASAAPTVVVTILSAVITITPSTVISEPRSACGVSEALLIASYISLERLRESLDESGPSVTFYARTIVVIID